MTQTITQMRAVGSLPAKNKLADKVETSLIKKVWKLEDKIGMVGLVTIQGSLLPSHFQGTFPHWSLPAGICLGLMCYQYRAWVQRDLLYTIGNVVGLTLNGLMLLRIAIGV